MLNDDFGAEEFQRETGVSRETLNNFRHYELCIRSWQERFNLVGQKSLESLWHRHFYDSAQLIGLWPSTPSSVVDLGTGAGFPGMVLSIMGQPNVELVESSTKKCLFLSEVAKATNVNVKITNDRLESSSNEVLADVVTARALAPLTKLLGYVHLWLRPGGTAFLHKGRSIEQELTQAYKDWTMRLHKHPSRTDPTGVVLEIKDLAPANEK